MAHPRRILVVRTDRIGDVVLATPLIRALRESFPEAYIAALVHPYTRDVLLHNPHLNSILVDDGEREHHGMRGFWNQIRALRKHRFDTALLLLPTERLAWMLFAAGIRTRVSVGLKLYQVLTFMKTVSRHKYDPLHHEADYCLDLGRVIGIQSGNLACEVVITENERIAGGAILHRAGFPRKNGTHTPRLIIIHPGTGRSSPNWKVEHYATLTKMCLADPNLWIVVTGNSQEMEFSPAFEALDSPRVINLIGRLTIREMLGVMSWSSLVVSASTGPMHLAAGLGIPTLSMFCRMSACSVQLWGPLGNRSEIVLPPVSYCSSRCPEDPHVCQFEDGITPSIVYNQIPQFLESTRQAPEVLSHPYLKIASLR